jgi:outer membrane protein assembly factor BamB
MDGFGRPSRRQVVGGLAALLGGGVVADQVPIGPYDAWKPAAGTWPTERRGPRNRAAATAEVPASPSVDWRVEGPGPGLFQPVPLVVNADRLYVAASAGLDGKSGPDGPGLVAYDRADGERVWTAPTTGRHLAVRDGRLFVGSGNPAARDAVGNLTAHDAVTGERLWRRRLPFPPTGLLPASGAVFAVNAAVVAHDQSSGRRRWHDPAIDAARQPLAADGALFLAGFDPLSRLEQRRVLDVILGDGPEREWEAPVGTDGFQPAPVAAAGNVVVPQSAGFDDTTLEAFDRGEGSRVWTALRASETDEVLTGPVAVGRDDTVYAATVRDFRSDAEREGRVATVQAFTPDGTRRWRAEADGPGLFDDVVVAGETVVAVVAGGDDTPTRVRALASGDGSRRWERRVDVAEPRLVPAGGTLFVAGEDGSVVALR